VRPLRIACGLLLAIVIAAVAGAQVVGEGYQEVAQLGRKLREPAAVVFLDAERLAVADHAADTVSVFHSDGRLLWVADDLGLDRPSGLCASPRGIWVADAGNHRVLLLSERNGALLETITLGTRVNPTDVTLGSGQTLWVSASPNNMLLLVNPLKHSLLVLETVAGKALRAPRGLAADDDGGVWVTEALGGKVHHIDDSGELLATVGGWGLGAGQFAKPKDLARLPGGGMAVLDTQLGVVQLLDERGGFLRLLADAEGLVRFKHGLGIAAFGDKLAVADAGSGRVHVFQAGGSAFDQGSFPAPETLLDQTSIREMAAALICRQCHDGTRSLNSGIWDPEAYSHSLEYSPAESVPANVRLTEGGDLSCFTCHAMHRDASAADVGRGPGTSVSEVDLADENEQHILACEECHQSLLDGSLTQPRRSHPVVKAIPFSADRETLDSFTPYGGDDVRCRTCHRPHGALAPNLLVVTASSSSALCRTCHRPDLSQPSGHPLDARPDEELAATLSELGGTLSPDGRLACLTCHSPHKPASASLVRFAGGTAATCALCHQGQADHLTESAHYESSCVDCHGLHSDNLPTNATCLDCHDEQRREQHRGGHGDRVCMDCHRVHETDPMSTWMGAVADPFSLRCLSCHHLDAEEGDAPRVAAYEHPVEVFSPAGDAWTSLAGLPLFDEDGAPMPPGGAGVVACGTCHHTHGPDASSPTQKLRRPGWKQACAMCHGPEALIFYQYFHQRETLESLKAPEKRTPSW